MAHSGLWATGRPFAAGELLKKYSKPVNSSDLVSDRSGFKALLCQLLILWFGARELSLIFSTWQMSTIMLIL